MVNNSLISCQIFLDRFSFTFYSLNNVVEQTKHKKVQKEKILYAYKNAPNISIIYSRETIRWIPREAIKQCNEKNEQINFPRCSLKVKS